MNDIVTFTNEEIKMIRHMEEAYLNHLPMLITAVEELVENSRRKQDATAYLAFCAFREHLLSRESTRFTNDLSRISDKMQKIKIRNDASNTKR